MSCNSTSSAVEVHLAPWPQNPFAWDILDDDGCVKPEPYDELEWLSPYLKVNYGISTVCGGIFSLYLLYLVVFHTIESLVPYKKIILCCAVSDVTYWIIENFCQFKARQIDGVFLMRLDGPAGYFSRDFQVTITAVYVTAICLVNTLLPAQTYFRYYALTSNSPAVRPELNYGSLWFNQYPLPILVIGDIRGFWHCSFFIYSVLCAFICYSLTLFIGFKGQKNLRIVQNTSSRRTKHLQVQLSRYLLLQTTIQLLTSVIPVSVIIFAGFFRLDAGLTPTFCMVALSWIPIINPLLTMIVIAPYLLRNNEVEQDENEAMAAAIQAADTAHHDTRKDIHYYDSVVNNRQVDLGRKEDQFRKS
uniref:G_PROTEIN_RECEP_F1_2 domain-containing protein n=1 Tax=Bursaphelenchus xylophilus TaxID=6326 RepID=A0A1I7RJQ8_BURXY